MNPLIAFVFDRVIRIGLHLTSEREYLLYDAWTRGKSTLPLMTRIRIDLMQRVEDIAWGIEEWIAKRVDGLTIESVEDAWLEEGL